MLAIDVLRQAVVGDAGIDERRGWNQSRPPGAFSPNPPGWHAVLMVIFGGAFEVQPFIEKARPAAPPAGTARCHRRW